MNWEGTPEPCMGIYENKTLIEHTINAFKGYDVQIIAPEYDKGNFDIYKQIAEVTYNFNDSPLNRMICATNDMADDDYIIRTDGRNFCVDVEQAIANLKLAIENKYDCVRFPENFCPIFSSDVYRVGALRNLTYRRERVWSATSVDIHPKYFLDSKVITPKLDKYTNEYLKQVRDIFGLACLDERINVDKTKHVSVADQITFHYTLADKYFPSECKVLLDIACGSGHGTELLKHKSDKLFGIDIDKDVIDLANTNNINDNISFIKADVNKLTMIEDNSVDVITAFEIIEHILPKQFLDEMYRVLKPGGTIFISTPQNIIGDVPVINCHIKEFSLDEIKTEVSRLFKIEKVIGLKQGTIYFDNDEVGSNTFIIAKKRKE
jgi:2-polyprenyl-3-methyl-5-hydroxy-6-metoxy-1,4-benzoquinol methylase